MYNEKEIISVWNANMYDQKVIETDDVDFLISVIGNQPKRILEVCCGSGRILVPLAKAGHVVFGLDADMYMLSKIQAKVKGLDNIQWRKADAVHDEWGKDYDIVVLAGNILYNIVSDMDYAKSQELFILKAAAALKPGGYIFIDYRPGGHYITQSPPSHKNDDSKWVVWEGTDRDGNFGRMVLLGDRYDADTGLGSFIRRFEITLKSGEIVTQDIQSHKHFAPLEQLHSWLRKAGFVIEQEYGDFKKNAITDESTSVIIYARKAEEITYVPIDESIKQKIIV